MASFESPDLILYIFLFFGDKNMGQIDQKLSSLVIHFVLKKRLENLTNIHKS